MPFTICFPNVGRVLSHFQLVIYWRALKQNLPPMRAHSLFATSKDSVKDELVRSQVMMISTKM